MMRLVGVYGTLRKGESASGMLYNQKYIGKGITKKSYLVISYGSFPGIVRLSDINNFGKLVRRIPRLWDNHVGRVAVEVYQVNNFQELCYYEGYPSLYITEKVNVKLHTGEEVSDVEVFVLNDISDVYVQLLLEKNEYGILDWIEYKRNVSSFSKEELEVMGLEKIKKEENKYDLITIKAPPTKKKSKETIFNTFNWGGIK